MASTVTPSVRWLASQWDGLFPDTVLSGIIGDEAHNRSGYHFGAAQQASSTNYSVTRIDDRPPLRTDHNAATAIDMSSGTATMIVTWNRFFVVWQNRNSDPRAKYLNAINGWNGVGSAERLDFVSGNRTTTDSSHKWHVHAEVRRRYSNDMTAMRAVISVLVGETHNQWLASIGAGGATSSEDEIDMGKGSDHASNADTYLWRGLMRLEDKVPGIIGDAGDKVTIDNQMAKVLKAIATGVVALHTEMAELKSEVAGLRAEQK